VEKRVRYEGIARPAYRPIVTHRPLLSKLLGRLSPSDVPSELTQYVDIDSYRIQKTGENEDVGPGRGEQPLRPQTESGGTGGTSEPEPEPLSKILELLNERFSYDFDEGDRIFIEQLKKNVQERDAVQKSTEVNSASDARLTFGMATEDELQGMIDKNFQLYRKITDDEASGELFFDLLFDHVREEIEEG